MCLNLFQLLLLTLLLLLFAVVHGIKSFAMYVRQGGKNIKGKWFCMNSKKGHKYTHRHGMKAAG